MKKWALLMVFAAGMAGNGWGQVDTAAVGKEADRFLQRCDSLQHIGKYREGLLFADSAINLLEKAKLNQGYQYLKTLNSKCTFLYKQGIYPEAEKMGLAAKNLAENLFGRSHLEYANCLSTLGIIYYYQNRFDLVDSFWLESKNIYGDSLGKENVQYAKLLNNLGSLYRVLERFTEAEVYFQEAKDIRLKLYGVNSLEYADILNNIGTLYYYTGRLNEAELLWLKTKEIRKRTLGTKHPNYADILNNLASYYNETGQLKKSENIYKETITVQEQSLGKEHPDYARSLNNLANLYQDMGRFSEAEQLYLKAKDIREKKLGKVHEGYAGSLLNLGNLYRATARYTEAESACLEAQEIYRKIFGTSHENYAMIIQNLGIINKDMGRYEKAENLFWEVVKIRDKVLGKSHHLYATSLYNLALLYDDSGRFSESEPLFQTAKDIFENSFGEEHPKYAACLNGLAGLYLHMGRYEAAEILYLEAKNIRKKTFGKDHRYYGESLHNLAFLYQILGKKKESEAYYKEAISVWAKTLGKSHPFYATALNGLATLYNQDGRYTEAEPLYFEVKSIRRRTIGKKHPHYAMLLNNLATFYAEQKRFKKAKPLLLKSKHLLEQSTDKRSPDYGRVLNNLAALNEDLHRYEQAESLYLQSLILRAEILGKNHPDYAVSVFSLADFYFKVAHSLADSTLSIAAPIQRTIITASARHLSEKELADYSYTFQNDLHNQLSYALARPNYPGLLPAITYDNALFFKGFLLQAAATIKNRALADTSIAKTWHRLAACHRQLGREYAKSIAQRDSAYIARLEQQANDLEKDLARSVAGFGDAFKPVGWKDVQAHLHPDEAAVEFIQFKKTFPRLTDSILYAALLLRPLPAGDSSKAGSNDQPHFIPLFEEKQLTEKLSCKGLENDAVGCANQRYSLARSSAIHRLLWQPLDSLLKGANTVYYSPSGQLHWLDFGALSVGGGQTLSDKYRLVRLGSTRQLVVRDSVLLEKAELNALLFGGIRYDADSNAIAKANEKLDALHDFAMRGQELSFRFTDSTLRAGAWRYLPQSAIEIENISHLLDSRKIPFSVLSGFDATEEAFKCIGINKKSPPRILHLATHGFFFPSNVHRPSSIVNRQPEFSISDHPMIRSGLVLAGANHAWKTGKPYREGAEDGILTAYEISQMNLRGTELVVLSACQTGLGDLSANEGVYGLQRAFKIAGARYLVMSLQPVPDKPTQEFMSLLYQNWLSQKLHLPDAFREAQAAMRKKYPGQPANWAGWILME